MTSSSQIDAAGQLLAAGSSSSSRSLTDCRVVLVIAVTVMSARPVGRSVTRRIENILKIYLARQHTKLCVPFNTVPRWVDVTHANIELSI